MLFTFRSFFCDLSRERRIFRFASGREVAGERVASRSRRCSLHPLPPRRLPAPEIFSSFSPLPPACACSPPNSPWDGCSVASETASEPAPSAPGLAPHGGDAPAPTSHHRGRTCRALIPQSNRGARAAEAGSLAQQHQPQHTAQDERFLADCSDARTP